MNALRPTRSARTKLVVWCYARPDAERIATMTRTDITFWHTVAGILDSWDRAHEQSKQAE